MRSGATAADGSALRAPVQVAGGRSWPAATDPGRSMVASRRAVVERSPRDIRDSDPADSTRRRAPSPARWAAWIRLMMGSLEPDRQACEAKVRGSPEATQGGQGPDR
jgi:hypothetical protein